MSVEVVRVGRHIELQFVGAELIEVRGSDEEPYGDGSITLTPESALKLAKKLIEAALETMEETGEEEASAPTAL
jgi:hypothetical protein